MIKKFIIILSLLFLTAFNKKGYDHSLQIRNSKNNTINNFIINIVDNDEERARGLMWVTDLPQNYGMLFEFKNEQVVNMWMKNTKISLDMLFIDETGKIISIKNDTTPESLDIISSGKPVKKVLEINGGLTKKLGIKIGDTITIH